ncbi:precorrin-6A synthase (deacetylating) [Pelagibacterium limicola]|uniref:precorrin-6A synthase (deacetylating) n=1 Tax=Pelagibacterium limicola TaxID=2791022 RepID=UPI0018AFA5D5|nr:precorrin-6A synthase (deacetylating) [Pelagibacterium limicola]
MPRQLVLIGIGTGNPEHLTVEGINALERADVLFVPTKGEEKAALAAVRREIVARYRTRPLNTIEFALPVRDTANVDYKAGVVGWHAEISAQYAAMIGAMGPDETGALLVWGDPGLYDSTLRILDCVRGEGIAFSMKVVPGITALQALTAAFAIPLNTIGNPVTITTGRKLLHGWPDGADSVVVMLDGQKSFAKLDSEGLHIWWGAYVGMEQQMLIEGPLADVAEKIALARDHARAEHGWIMDVYLLRRV